MAEHGESIEALATVTLDARTLESLGPKTLDRILRLQRFLALGRADPSAGLARLAADAGYADQAHLGRDCRALADATPTQLIA